MSSVVVGEFWDGVVVEGLKDSGFQGEVGLCERIE